MFELLEEYKLYEKSEKFYLKELNKEEDFSKSEYLAKIRKKRKINKLVVLEHLLLEENWSKKQLKNFQKTKIS